MNVSYCLIHPVASFIFSVCLILSCCVLLFRPKKTLYSKKYGVDLIRFTHAVNTVIYTSNKVDDTIRYLSLHDNKYIRYFPGHTKK